MWRRLPIAIALFCIVSLTVSTELTDDDIRVLLIKQSLASYSESCPCPYNLDRAGTLCGKRSAYSRQRGETPLCFSHDVTNLMVDAFRKRSP